MVIKLVGVIFIPSRRKYFPAREPSFSSPEDLGEKLDQGTWDFREKLDQGAWLMPDPQYKQALGGKGGRE